MTTVGAVSSSSGSWLGCELAAQTNAHRFAALKTFRFRNSGLDCTGVKAAPQVSFCVASRLPCYGLLERGVHSRAPMQTIPFLFAALLVGQTEGPKFAAHSNLVSVPTRVQTKSGETIYGLRAEQFVIEDNGVKQTVKVDQDPESGGCL